MSSPTIPAPPIDDSAQPVAFGFANSYARLPDRFFARVNPTPASAPALIKVNAALAHDLQLSPDELASESGVQILAGNRVAEGSEPLAMAYAGHQFGHFVPQLGDGRANLLGEVIGLDGKRYDIQLKGSGRTPFSRGGDGRAALGPVLREYLVSEAMAALGVPTTRALAAVTTGDRVYRETVLPGAVFTRVAASHLRVGTFQYFAARGDIDALRTLADYAIARHYPEAEAAENPHRAFLDGVIARQARLVGHLEPAVERRLAAASVGALLDKTMHLSGEVYTAMQARGFRGEITDSEKLHRRVYWDLYYVTHWSLLLDAQLILRTVWLVPFPNEAAY